MDIGHWSTVAQMVACSFPTQMAIKLTQSVNHPFKSVNHPWFNKGF